jgi:hypothetical protein
MRAFSQARAHERPDTLTLFPAPAAAARPCPAQLHQPTSSTTSSGVAHRYFGTAVGKGRQSVKTEIERLKFDTLTCRQAVVECAKV